MRRLGRVLLGLVVVGGLLRLAGLVAARLLPSHGDAASDTVELVTIFDGTQMASEARGFRGATATTVFGGLDLDLRGVTLDDGHARLVLRTAFGGVRVVVPSGWRVEMSGRATLGEHAVSVAETSEPTGHLDVEATTILGGLLVTDDE